MLSASCNLVCWTEVDRDPRWEMQIYSVIKLLNLATGQVSQVTEKTRYFSPDLSKDGQAIAAIEVDEENNSYLVILRLRKKCSQRHKIYFVITRCKPLRTGMMSMICMLPIWASVVTYC